MNPIQLHDRFYLREQARFLHATENFQIEDPETGRILLKAEERPSGLMVRLLRILVDRHLAPLDLKVCTPAGEQVLRLRRNKPLARCPIEVFDAHDRRIGAITEKRFSALGALKVMDADRQPIGELRRRWMKWSFLPTDGPAALAEVTRSWAGILGELFYDTDNYILRFDENAPRDTNLRVLLLAAALCIDLMMKE